MGSLSDLEVMPTASQRMVLLPSVEGQAEGCRLAMNVLWLSLGGVLVTCGAVACVIPVLPGPLLSFCGLLCMAATQKSPSLTTFVMFGLITAIATVLDPANTRRKDTRFPQG